MQLCNEYCFGESNYIYISTSARGICMAMAPSRLLNIMILSFKLLIYFYDFNEFVPSPFKIIFCPLNLVYFEACFNNSYNDNILTTPRIKLYNFNSRGCSSTGQILSLLLRCYQFESHKSHGYWRFTWLLTSGPVGLVEMRASWPEHPY
jgi:hypothetical protein